MKKLLFFMLLVFYIQCKTEDTKEKCGIVTEMVTISTDTKSKSKPVPVSSYSCEYVVIMPKNTADSLIVIKYLEENNFKFSESSKSNAAVRLYSRGGDVSTDGVPVPIKGPPPPPIKESILKNVINVNPWGQPVSTFQIASQVATY